MELEKGLHLKQKQTTVMAPRLRQSLRILQANGTELASLLAQESLQNPLLEIERSDDRNISIDSILAGMNNDEYKDGYVDFDEDRKAIKAYWSENIHQKVPLAEHMISQMTFALSSEKELAIAEFIVGSLDERGFLTLEVNAISRLTGCEVEVVERVRRVLMQQEPYGVGAKNLGESLVYQLKGYHYKKSGFNEALCILNKWSESKVADMQAIKERVSFEKKAYEKGIALIRKLHTSPAMAYSDEIFESIIPDIILQREGGEYRITVNGQIYPRLGINPYYLAALKDGALDSITREYIRNKLKSALWLMQCIVQREQTLHKITKALLDLQSEFFKGGRKKLKPMILKDVATYTDLHISTISRATRGKYIQTPYGVYELKYFFKSGVGSLEGGVSSVGIKEMIKELIAREKPDQPLSDREIAVSLADKGGWEISRRTIAKYRKQMLVPSSYRRKQLLMS